MEKIIDPISVDLLKAELTPEKKLCDTNKAGNEIYVVDGIDSPNVLLEIGRLREIAFRDSGGGTGQPIDLDEFDTTTDRPYKQIIIWDPDASAIIGGYRFILGPDIKMQEDGQPHITSSHMFRYSERFIRDYLPHTMIEVRNEGGEVVMRDYTGEDGYLPAFPAVPGRYTYREVLAPEGYFQ